MTIFLPLGGAGAAGGAAGGAAEGGAGGRGAGGAPLLGDRRRARPHCAAAGLISLGSVIK